MKDNKKNSPFFERFLENSIEEEMQDIRGQKEENISVATTIQNDLVITAKYPSDNDEYVTLKYPSDNDEYVTLKYPSDGDDDTPIIDDVISSSSASSSTIK